MDFLAEKHLFGYPDRVTTTNAAPELMHVECMLCGWHGRRHRTTEKPCPKCGSINVRRMVYDRPWRNPFHTRWRAFELVSGATEEDVIAAGQDDTDF